MVETQNPKFMEKKKIFTSLGYWLVAENGELTKIENRFSPKIIFRLAKEKNAAGLLVRKTEYFSDGTYWTEPLDIEKNLIFRLRETSDFKNAVEVKKFQSIQLLTNPSGNLLFEYNLPQLLQIGFLEIAEVVESDDFLSTFAKAVKSKSQGLSLISECYYDSGEVAVKIPLWIMFDEPVELVQAKDDPLLEGDLFKRVEKDYPDSKFVYKVGEYLFPIKRNFVVIPRTTVFKEIEYAE